MFKGIEIKYGLRMNDSLLMNVPSVFFFSWIITAYNQNMA